MKRVMKRALADRAKLDLPAGTGGAASPPSEGPATNASSNVALQNGRIGFGGSPSESQPPLKIPRIGSEEAPSVKVEQAPSAVRSPAPVAPPARPDTNRSAGPTSPRPSARPDTNRSNHSTPSSNKRQRRETSSQAQQQSSGDQEEPDESDAFYLKHQNKALAIELKSLQAQIRDLTDEREYRRRSCLQAVQALHSLQATWTSLETSLGQEPPPTFPLPSSPGGGIPSSTVGSTDETAVEWTLALHRALQALGNQSSNSRAGAHDDHHEDGPGSHFPNSPTSGEMKMGELAANVTGRANCLQEWLWQVLRSKQTKLSAPPENAAHDNSNGADDGKKKSELEAELEKLRAQVTELTNSRDDFLSRERRLRRNIYRLDVGMLSDKQLIQSVVGTGDELNDDPERLAVQKESILKGATVAATENSNSVVKSESDTAGGDGVKAEAATSSVSAKVVLDLQRELEESRLTVANRDKSIEEMTERIRGLEKRINELTIKQHSDGDKEKLEAYESMSLKLDVAEKQVTDMTDKLQKAREKWAQCAGNEKAAIKALEELQDKHQKKWSELAAAEDVSEENGEITRGLEQARKIAELEHKLCQAMENVRQAETARSNLRDALAMNESLQARLNDPKAKAAVEKSEKGERSSSKHSSDNHTTPSSSRSESRSEAHSGSHHRDREREGGSDRISAEKAEKLYRENKKMRKEIAAVIASKEGHKAKLERVEKERNALAEVNVRLMKQVTEKDEMNAKSLSSILHLKGLTEQLTQERKNMEDEVKSAEQLALAARLATNAKERLSEELVKEKLSLEEELRELEKTQLDTRKELGQKISDCADASGKTSTLNSELSHALKRCDEFVAQTEEQGGEIRKLVDALDKAERTAKESREKLAEMVKNSSSSSSFSSGNSGFTADQLKTQIQVLKNRLACPVCHFRDKECIIMRCRHMHCKQCVEERLNNRSRRCPTCNNPFGKSDMEDIFLG
uniref:E3 ubiquitin protein ligase n=1 Tax=Entomoneis paludosa TaxID=265537 RepID=A0A7S3DRI5_9STRA|mmetsp:Transcript_30731/g.64168  ORF Transcript_30731/g.64168 Transcript_30731/m.64168 type:complete len:974 (+) Transcript_30731:354-3275(+)|eukprot:CAMPEP_0172459440 /NCGR_PEP_ID=MMETSP1065-20121228/32589_1 /TAXON_ID=265537 /ORGANISM="Amphiprora paludosa, Strain CCMP125" /LENGTH=973 /DNA_ID=CAMNT_0013214119 /DNA_START=309 /DNA_END=3230 /DNA_ORIENTATION=+